MRFTVAGSIDDAPAGLALIEELASHGLSVAPTFRALDNLDELTHEARQMSSSSSLLLLISNTTAPLIGSLVRLDELLSLRRSGTQLVHAVLLDGEDAPAVDVIRVAQRRGAHRRQDIVASLLAAEASALPVAHEPVDDNEYWIAYSYWRLPAYARALLIIATLLFVLACTSPFKKTAVVVFVAVVVVIVVADIQWIRPRRLRRWQRSANDEDSRP